ncbi:Lrp/AsnC family transcriptional regulator [Mucilaginibacter sp.]|uniref:Lrp/AsnC family transcriptional regulator n=1 Tax=Mucilaginibacter sp. TaxID=1882438 RepID=UPI0035636F3B
MQLDELHYAILNELQADSRLSNAEIGRRIGLTAPAVSERIKRMQNEGIIKGFSLEIDLELLGFQQQALIAVKLPHGYIDAFLKEAKKLNGITNITHTTGEYCFFVTVAVQSTRELERIIDTFGKLGQTTTVNILSVPVRHKPVTFTHTASRARP